MAKTSSRRFTSEKSANNFADKVNGKVNDLRNIDNAKSNFKVYYPLGENNTHDIGNEEFEDSFYGYDE